MIFLPGTRKGVIEAARIINAGGLVAFPTETFYGLAVNPSNGEALSRLFRVKKRPVDKPILLLVANRRQLEDLVEEIPPVYGKLIEKFWPGPLTLIFEAKKDLQPLLTASTGTVGIRMSSHSLAEQLINGVGGAITATSANLSGYPATVSVDEVGEQLFDAIDAVLDGGRTPGVSSSTVVRLEKGKLVMIREGMLCPEVLTFIASVESRHNGDRI